MQDVVINSVSMNRRLWLHQTPCTKLFPFAFTYWSHQSRNDEERVKELFDAIEELRTKFESIERPILDIESPAKVETPPSEKKLDDTPSLSAPAHGAEHSKPETDDQPKSSSVKADQVLDHEAELAKLESEFGKVSQDYSTEEIGDWEFDELEKELASS